MQLNNLTREKTSKTKKRIGRGGKRGKTSGRGTKGQKARAGHRIRPESRDMIKKIPKRRGYGKHRADSVNDSRIRASIVNLTLIEKHFTDGEEVSVKTLHEKNLIRTRAGKKSVVKILGTGTLSKKVTFANDLVLSGSARKKLGL